jgi:hypothetical protein
MFERVSRMTTISDIDAYFLVKIDKVKSLLPSASCVCLTSDLWSDNAKKDYLMPRLVYLQLLILPYFTHASSVK